MDLYTAPIADFAALLHWGVLAGYRDAQDGAPLATPSQLLARAEATGGHDHADALATAYQAGRRHFEMTVNRPQVERAPESRAGRAVEEHRVSPARLRPQPHVEIYPRSQATGRPAISVPANTKPQAITQANVKAPWR